MIHIINGIKDWRQKWMNVIPVIAESLRLRVGGVWVRLFGSWSIVLEIKLVLCGFINLLTTILPLSLIIRLRQARIVYHRLKLIIFWLLFNTSTQYRNTLPLWSPIFWLKPIPLIYFFILRWVFVIDDWNKDFCVGLLFNILTDDWYAFPFWWLQWIIDSIVGEGFLFVYNRMLALTLFLIFGIRIRGGSKIGAKRSLKLWVVRFLAFFCFKNTILFPFLLLSLLFYFINKQMTIVRLTNFFSLSIQKLLAKIFFSNFLNLCRLSFARIIVYLWGAQRNIDKLIISIRIIPNEWLKYFLGNLWFVLLVQRDIRWGIVAYWVTLFE